MLLHRAFGYLDANDPTSRAISHFETELARIAACMTRKNSQPTRRLRWENYSADCPFSYAAVETSGGGGEKPEQFQMKQRKLIAATLMAGLSPPYGPTKRKV